MSQPKLQRDDDPKKNCLEKEIRRKLLKNRKERHSPRKPDSGFGSRLGVGKVVTPYNTCPKAVWLSMTSQTDYVSPALVAFIVDQYLCGNQFYKTMATFRNEALPLFNLLSLEEMLNQYILTKRQNERLEEENVMVMQEKNRIQKLLQDIQNALDSFNARSPMSNVTAMITNSVIVPPMENSIKTPLAKPMANVNFSSPIIRVFHKKRKDISTVDESAFAKKRRGRQPRKRKQVPAYTVDVHTDAN
ncbi:hypothetical protein V8G54_009354 [Vigna mungo]|uniref:Uncharacterized protein n=1 Tax=Vigna mungo TaxID=3915 RepID=A0AAQ3NX14_VIGMU